MDPDTKTTKKARRPRWARVLLFFVWVLGVLVGLVAAVVLGFFGSGSVRQPVLRQILASVDEAVPGRLTYGAASWADVSTIVMNDVLWIVERAAESDTSAVETTGRMAPTAVRTDTLAAAGELRLEVDLSSLLHRRIRVVEFAGSALDVDVPTIQSTFAGLAGGDAEEPSPKKSGKIPFFDVGIAPSVPAATVDRLTLDFARVRLAPNRILRGSAEFQADLTREAGGRIVIGPLDLAVRTPGLGAGTEPVPIETRLTGSLRLDLGAAEAEGQLVLLWEPDWQASLSLVPVSADHFQLRLSDRIMGSEAGVVTTPGLADSIALVLDVSLTREDLSFRAIDLEGNLHLPSPQELSRRPFVPELAGLPEVGPIDGRMSAAISLTPEFSVSGNLEFEPNALVDTARASGRYASAAWQVEDLEIVARDARIRATAEGRGDSLQADIGIRLDGVGFLEPWMAEPPPIESVQADLTARVRGVSRAPSLSLDASALATIAGTKVEQFDFSAGTSGWGDVPVDFDLLARARGYSVTIAGELDQELEGAWVTPVKVREGILPRAPIARVSVADSATSTPRGQGRIDWADGVSLRGLRIESDYGRAKVDATVDTTSRVTAKATVEWAEVPAVLLEGMKLRSGQVDSLRRTWRRDGPFVVDTNVLFDERGRQVRFSADVVLPGPSTFAAVLPESTRTEGLGRIQGRIRASGPSAQDLRIEGNLVGEGWLDRLRLFATVRGDTVHVDTLDVGLLGLTLGIDGDIGEQFDLHGSLSLPTLERVEEIFAVVPDSLSASARAGFTVKGAQSRPAIDLEADGAFVFGEIRVPRYSLTASRNGEPLRVLLDLPLGLRTRGQEFDKVSLTLAAETDSLFPLDLEFEAHSQDLAGSAGLVLTQEGTGWLASVDSLQLSALQREIRSRGPFTIRVDVEAEHYEVRGLDLAGTIGEFQADGFVEPGNAELSVDAELDLPPRPVGMSIPPEVWPQRLTARIRADGETELNAAVRVAGIPLETGRLADLDLTARSAQGGLEVAGSVVANGDSLLRAYGFLPGTFQVYPPALHVDPGELSFVLEAAGLPVLVPSPQEVGRREKILVDANIDLRGTTAEPELDGEIRGSFQEWPALSDFLIVGRASYQPSEGLSFLRTHLGVLRSGDASPGSGDSLFVASAAIPVQLDWQPFAIQFPPEERVHGSVASSGLSVGDFRSLLPPNVSASGRLDLNLEVDGPLRDPGVTGTVVARRLDGQLADGSRFAADGRLSVSGTALRPVVRGNIDVKSGVIVIPETTKALLPVEGDARLWELARVDTSDRVDSNQREYADAPDASADPAPVTISAADSLPPGAGSRPGPGSPVAQTPPMVEPDLDVTIDIPGSVWIRGRGLEVELEGNVQVSYAKTPILTGTLQARSGHLRLLGRYFEVDSGVVEFYGDEEIDPTLDLSLSTRVDGTTVRVVVSGTVKQPDLALSSDPEMEEGDIFSLLLLGRPLDQLDENQTELLKGRAGDLALSFGATRISSTLSGELGVDLVSVQPTSQGTGSALVIGKYISPRILLKYEQAIQSTEDFLVNVEYLLTRHLRLETFYGQQSQSGAELNWISEY